MNKILVTGALNIETNLQVDSFPVQGTIEDDPLRKIDGSVAGLGYNYTKALTTLGSEVNLLAMVGSDYFGQLIYNKLRNEAIDDQYVLKKLSETPQSIVLYDQTGQRKLYLDFKNLSQQQYPVELFVEAVKECSLVCLSTVDFSRPLLTRAEQLNKTIAVDLQIISSLEDTRKQKFMSQADILFMSGDKLPTTPEEWVKKVVAKYQTEIIVIGLGAKGVLMSVREDNFIERIPAVKTRKVVNTIGAGDALFSSFLHFYNQTKDPYLAIKKAVVFASYKIGASTAAEGFLSEEELNSLYEEVAN